MFNYKQKWQKLTDWKGWKWIYYLLLLIPIFLLIHNIFYVFDVLTKTSDEIRAQTGAAIPIGAECCWEYRSKPIFLAYYIFHNIVVLSLIFFSLKPKKFFYKFSIIFFPILLLIIYGIIFPTNL